MASPIIVKRWGGETVIDNVQVKQVVNYLRYFRTGEELLLMLSYDTSSGKYGIVGAGVFLLQIVEFNCSSFTNDTSLLSV